MQLAQHCGTEERRQRVLASAKQIGGLALNGLDFLEVLDADAPTPADRQKLIDLTFLKPDGVTGGGQPLLAPGNFVITGGVRIKDVRVTAVAAGADAKTLRLTLNAFGDFSAYSLRLVRPDGDDPPDNFDPALAEIIFSFKADCPTDFDCAHGAGAGEAPPPGPPIDYLAKDYESFRRLMLDRMAVTSPGWTERSPADPGVTLVEALAYAADLASYAQDAVATEAYLSRARLRPSARRHARLLGYALDEGCNARAFVALQASQDADGPALAPVGTLVLTRPSPDQGFGPLPPGLRPDPDLIRDLVRAGVVIFETLEPLTRLRTARNALSFHTWSGSDCCLPAGSCTAFIVGDLATTGLGKGDVLILAERIPFGGGAQDPADPAHRQAVRLIETPRERTDPLDDTPVLELRWGIADALAFPLNLQGDGGKPGAVAYGNVLLADHGRTLDYDFANSAPADVVAASLHAELRGRSALSPARPPPARRYRPQVTAGPITRSEPFDAVAARSRSARETLAQDQGAAIPQITLTVEEEAWAPRPDLLLSDRFAAEFVVEANNDGSAELRFGDGRFGKAPGDDVVFQARLRVGNGAPGRVGADAIGHIVTDDPDLFAGVSNPIGAVGGGEPQTLTSIKLGAPRAFKRQRRAVTAQDYADFAQQHPEVQRAVAERRWTGSWLTHFLAIDRRGGREVDVAFETELRAFLEPVRLAGHDLEIEPPAYVPLDIALVVCVAPGHYAEHIEAALLDRFAAGVSANGSLGFFHPDNFTFGQPVLLSRIIAEAMAVEGVRWVGLQLDGVPETGRFRRLDDQAHDYADTGVLPIDRREVACLDNDPSAPERGRLRFIMEGGR
jgi:hypothetical protein